MTLRIWGKKELGVFMTVSREVIFQRVMLPGTGMRLSKPSPLAGHIKQIIRHWPDGTNGLADIAVGHKTLSQDIWLLPSEVDIYVSLNDATPVVNVEEEISLGGEPWVIFRNADAVNNHYLAVTFVLEGKING
jgi:hypothetical protein